MKVDVKIYLRDKETKEVSVTDDVCKMQSAEDRSVARTEVMGKTVSTVFLPINHSVEGNLPILWETMVFKDDHFYGLSLRYSSEKEAEEGHAQVVKFLEGGGNPDKFKGLE